MDQPRTFFMHTDSPHESINTFLTDQHCSSGSALSMQLLRQTWAGQFKPSHSEDYGKSQVSELGSADHPSFIGGDC